MNQVAGQLLEAEFALADFETDEHIRTVLEYFASEVDNQIQGALVSELMERYVDVSANLEVKTIQLEKSDASRREAQEMALLGNWEFDIGARRLWWSDTMNHVLEIEDGAEVDERLYMQLVHQEDGKLVRDILKNLIRGVVQPEYRHRLKMADGRVKWVHLRCETTYDPYGNPVGVHGTVQDITKQKADEEKLKAYNLHLEELVQKKVAEVSLSQMTTIHALVALAESRDDETGEHISRTAQYCHLLAEELLRRGIYVHTVDRSFVEIIDQASPLHDIGKVGIPDAILLKPGKLTPEEFEIMKGHVEIGHSTLARVAKKGTKSAFVKMGMEIALNHHEKWDGSGYPRGLYAEEIPVSARIMAVADVYDALRSKRVYKPGFSHEKSAEIILAGRGSHFDPALVDIFGQKQDEFRTIFDSNAGSDA